MSLKSSALDNIRKLVSETWKTQLKIIFYVKFLVLDAGIYFRKNWGKEEI